jgi:hypothetical protein
MLSTCLAEVSLYVCGDDACVTLKTHSRCKGYGGEQRTFLLAYVENPEQQKAVSTIDKTLCRNRVP